MAFAKILNTYPDKSSVLMVVGTQANGPDSMDECVARVKDLWRECMDVDREPPKPEAKP